MRIVIIPIRSEVALFPWQRSRTSPARRRSILGILCIVVALSVTACGRSDLRSERSEKASSGGPAPPVIAADGVLCDLARRLAAADLHVKCLLGASDDPHSFRLEPSQKALISSARLLLISGYGLTPALASLPGAVAVSELAVPDSLPLDGAAAAAEAGGHGHDHGGRDPHVWHNPRHAAAMVGVISDRFVALAPASAAPIQRRAAQMRQVLEQLDSWNAAQFATVPAPPPPLASSHRAFASLAHTYDLPELPLVDGLSGSKALRPEAFRSVVERLRRERVPQLFAEQLPAPRTLRRISELSGVPIAPVPLAADGLAVGARGPLSLVATLTRNTCTIVTGWGGRCDEAAAATLEKRWEAIR